MSGLAESAVFWKVGSLMENIAMNFSVRTATAADTGIIGYINVQTWKTTYKEIVHQTFLTSLDPAEMAANAERRLQNPKLDCLVLVEGASNKVIGYAHIGPCREKNVDADGELYAIYLLEEFQNHGGGKLLFDAAVAKAKQRHFSKMMVSVFEKNLLSRKFYEKMGGDFTGSDHVDIENHRYLTSRYVWIIA